jgi:hypothetical protein
MVANLLGMRGAVFNVEPFAEKVGFPHKSNAIRAGKAKKLFAYTMSLAEARGKKSIPGRLPGQPDRIIMNPVDEHMPVAPKCRARVRFMEGPDLLEWLCGCQTKAAERQRRGLVWFYAMHRTEQTARHIEELKAEMVASSSTQEERDQALQELTAFLEEDKEEEEKRRPTLPPPLFKIFRKEGRICPAKRQPSTLTARLSLMRTLGFEEVTQLPSFRNAGPTWDKWHEAMKESGLSLRHAEHYLNKKGQMKTLYSFEIRPMTAAELEGTLDGLEEAEKEFIRGVVARIGAVDETQTEIDDYLDGSPLRAEEAQAPQ